jgi:hypothetical protein
LKGNTRDRDGYKKKIEYQVLSPGQLADHTPAGAGNIFKEMKKDRGRIDSE